MAEEEEAVKEGEVEVRGEGQRLAIFGQSGWEISFGGGFDLAWVSDKRWGSRTQG